MAKAGSESGGAARHFAIRAATLMSAAATSKRFVSASALLIYAYTCYPLAEPTSEHSLRLAHGLDAHELDRSDPFAANARRIAARVGVKNPERLSIRVGEESGGASMGANVTIGRRGACVVLPMELYDAFHAPEHLHAKYDIPKRDEIDFVLAHESAHIAKNHSVISGAWLPLSLVASCVGMRKIPNKLVAATLGVAGIVCGNVLLSWRLEHEADRVAAEHGFARGGVQCFQRKLSHNCEVRSAFNTRLITKEGNYLGDTSHPLLTSRIERLKLMIAAESNS